MDQKFKMLGLISVIMKVLAWIAAGLGFIFFLIILIGGGTPEAPRITSLVALLLGLVYWCFFFGAGEIIQVLLAIEQNTRK